eukprot:1152387-Pelagomonas_calceolata.AAC.1
MLSGCQNHIISSVKTECHNVAGRMIIKALSKSLLGAGLVNMDIGSDDRLTQHNLQIPAHALNRAIPLYLFPRPDAGFVRSIPGRPPHFVPTKIPPRSPQDRDIHFVEFIFCPDTNPFSTLEAATFQHANTSTRLKTCSPRNPNRNNKVTLHIILVSVAGTIYNAYTITPLIDLGLTRQKAKSLASKHALLFFSWTSEWGGLAERVEENAGEGESRRSRAWKPTLHIHISSAFDFFLGWLLSSLDLRV